MDQEDHGVQMLHINVQSGGSNPDQGQPRVVAHIWTERRSSQARREALERVRHRHGCTRRPVRHLGRRPRCGIQLIRSLKNDFEAGQDSLLGLRTGEARDPKWLSPGHVDPEFEPRPTDLIVHHSHEVSRPMLHFFSPEMKLETGDYLVRYKHMTYKTLASSFHAAKVYMWQNQGGWVYLGTDSVQVPST